MNTRIPHDLIPTGRRQHLFRVNDHGELALSIPTDSVLIGILVKMHRRAVALNPSGHDDPLLEKTDAGIRIKLE